MANEAAPNESEMLDLLVAELSGFVRYALNAWRIVDTEVRDDGRKRVTLEFASEAVWAQAQARAVALIRMVELAEGCERRLARRSGSLAF